MSGKRTIYVLPVTITTIIILLQHWKGISTNCAKGDVWSPQLNTLHGYTFTNRGHACYINIPSDKTKFVSVCFYEDIATVYLELINTPVAIRLRTLLII